MSDASGNIDALKLVEFSAKALEKMGVPDEDARITAEILVEADLLTAELAINPLTGKKIRQERSPFNYALRTVDGQKVLCLYDLDGREIRFSLGTDHPA